MTLRAYLRVSTDDQKDFGVGLDAQKHSILPHSPISWHEDQISGSTEAAIRPGLSALLDLIQPGEGIIVHARDRLMRNMVEMGRLRQHLARHGCFIFSVTEGKDDCDDESGTMEAATNGFMRDVLDSAAQMQRRQTRARILLAMKECIRSQRWVGATPFGWDVIDVPGQKTKSGKPMRRLISNEREQTILLSIQLRRKQGMGYHAIADDLNQAGIKSKSGGIWRAQQVKSVLEAAARPERSVA